MTINGHRPTHIVIDEANALVGDQLDLRALKGWDRLPRGCQTLETGLSSGHTSTSGLEDDRAPILELPSLPAPASEGRAS